VTGVPLAGTAQAIVRGSRLRADQPDSIDGKPRFYAPANQTPARSGQPVFEQRAGGNG